MLWLLPLGALFVAPRWASLPLAPSLVAAGVAAAFALAGLVLRQLLPAHDAGDAPRARVRRAVPADRRALSHGGVLRGRPPRSGSSRREYAPATANHPRQLEATLRARRRSRSIALPQLLALVATPPAVRRHVPRSRRFSVWSQTSLSRIASRRTSSSTGRTAASSAASRSTCPSTSTAPSAQTWQGIAAARGMCSARSSASARRTGSMLHAERGLCDGSGGIARRGRRARRARLSRRCRSSRRPIRTRTCIGPPRRPARRDSRIADLQVVVYGWSLHPLFASGRVAWPIDGPLSDRLTGSREPFWETLLDAGDRTYHVLLRERSRRHLRARLSGVRRCSSTRRGWPRRRR